MIKPVLTQNCSDDIESVQDPYKAQLDRTLETLEVQMTERNKLESTLRTLASQKRAQDQKLFDQAAVIQQKKDVLRDLLSKSVKETGVQTEVSTQDIAQMIAEEVIIPKEESTFDELATHQQELRDNANQSNQELDFGAMDFRIYIGILVQSKQRLLSEVTRLDEEKPSEDDSILGKLANATQNSTLGKFFKGFGGAKPKDGPNPNNPVAQQSKWSASQTERRNEAISNHQVTWSDEVLAYIRNPLHLEVCKQKMANLIRNGSLLPLEARADVWKRLLGNRDHITRRLYTFFAENRETCSPTAKRMIELDIARTFPELNISPQFAQIKLEAQKLLQMFELHRPDIGYRSGYGHLMVGLRLHMNSFDTFVAFCSLVMGDPIQYLIGSGDQQMVGQYFTALDTVIMQKLPLVGRKLNQLGLNSVSLAFGWFAVIGAIGNNLGIDKIFRIWDMYFLRGEVVMVRLLLLSLSRLKLDIGDDAGQLYTQLRDLEGLLGKDYYTCVGNDLLSVEEYQRNFGSILAQ